MIVSSLFKSGSLPNFVFLDVDESSFSIVRFSPIVVGIALPVFAFLVFTFLVLFLLLSFLSVFIFVFVSDVPIEKGFALVVGITLVGVSISLVGVSISLLGGNIV